MREGKIVAWMLSCILLHACATSPKTGHTRDGQTLAEVNTQLGIEYMREGMYESALENFNKAIKHDSRYSVAYMSLGMLYQRLGENDLADKHFRKAYKLKPDDPETLNNYGRFLCQIGRLDEADKMFAQAIRDPLYRTPEKALTNAGLCAAKRPNAEAAEKYYRLALEKNPRFRPALYEMVRISFAGERYLAARAYLQRLQEVAPLVAEFLWIGVRTESALGDLDASASYALLLKNQFPESEQTQALLEWERAQRGR